MTPEGRLGADGSAGGACRRGRLRDGGLFAAVLAVLVCCAGAQADQSLDVAVLPGAFISPASPLVIELYTSQGCSSCPPADRVAGRLARHKHLLVLSLPVTYWDYLGWKDTLADASFDSRQRNYAQEMGRRLVYTPQMVVDGESHVIGSDRGKVTKAIRTQAKRLSRRIGINFSRSGRMLRLNVAAGPDDIGPIDATVWLVRYDPSHTVKIGRGENRGRTLTYTNVVRSIEPVGVWRGNPVTLRVPDPPNAAGSRIAAILQDDSIGEILGAARLGN